MSHPIEELFNPQSIAVVGSSNNPQTAGYGFTDALLKYGYKGNIYPVNPKYSEILGLKTYPRVKDIFGPVEYVISAVSAPLVPALLEDCSHNGVKVIHLFTARFSETGRPDAAKLEQDCLFNNAGGPSRGNLETVTKEDFIYSLTLLLGGPVFGIKYAAPVMKAQGSGCIINNSSIAAIRTGQGGYLYSAAKAAVTQLTKVAGVELGPYGIRVNCISPGAIATPIFWGGSQVANTLEPAVNARKLEKLKQNLAKATPLKKAGLDKDIAMAALFLASDEGSFVTCHDLVVDGGRTSLFHEAS